MQRIRRELVAEKVIDRIFEYIVSHQLKPGDKLPTERELSAMFSVGRPAVREALCALSVMYLIDVIQGDGIYLADVSGSALLKPFQLYMDLGVFEAYHLFEVWIALESDVARLAAERATDEQIDILWQALQCTKEGIHDEHVFINADTHFHAEICRIAANPMLICLMTSLKEIVFKIRTATTRFVEIRQMAYEAHINIFEAIKARDEIKAYNAMTEHLGNIQKSVALWHDFYSGELGRIFRKEFNIHQLGDRAGGR